MTIFYTAVIAGEKCPLVVKPSDTVRSLRMRIWQKTHRAIKMLELDDDVKNATPPHSPRPRTS
jgi:hypothetical protein